MERLRHFASRLAMNIEGLGYSTVEQVLELKLAEEPADLYRITAEQWQELEHFGPKSAENMIARLAGATAPTLARFLYSLGIPQVGEATAEILAAELGSLDRVRKASEEELRTVEGIGPSMAVEIRQFFAGAGGELVQHLLDAGVQPQESAAPGEGPFTRKTIGLTGRAGNKR